MIAGRSIDRRSATGLRFAVAAAALLWLAIAAVAQTFPALTGRIVDQANVISASARQTIEPKLADLEAKSGIQLVVATVNSLEGQEIEPYANALFRNWKLGEPVNWILILIVIVVVVLLIVSPGFRWFFFNVVLNILISSAMSGRGGGSSGGGGFSGGGGSSGGGGASGSW
jgi:uncharacterized protein